MPSKKAEHGTATLSTLSVRSHIRFKRRQWGHLLFSGESRIQLSRANDRKRFWRRRNERYTDACSIEFNRWGGGSLHFLAGVTQI